MTWTNADGLQVLMHGEQGEVKVNGGSVRAVREALVCELTDATTLADATVTIYANDAFLPADCLLLKASLVVDTAFTTTTGTLDIGLYDASGSAIVGLGGDDAIDAAVAAGALTADAVVDCDGAAVGARITENAYVGFTYDTAVFTAGAAKLVLEYVQV